MAKVTDKEIIDEVWRRLDERLWAIDGDEPKIKKVVNKLKRETGVVVRTEFRSTTEVIQDLIDEIIELDGGTIVNIARSVGIDDEVVIKDLEDEAMSERERADKQRVIQTRVSEAHAALEEATKLADELGVMVNFDLAYGMGGTYFPKGERDPDHWAASGATLTEGRWVSSSSMC